MNHSWSSTNHHELTSFLVKSTEPARRIFREI